MLVRRVSLCVMMFAAAASTRSLRGQAAAVAAPPRSTGVLTTDWLQANALPLDRAMHSLSVTAGVRRDPWSFEAGWLRVARTLSTVQGGTLGVGRILTWRTVRFIPSVAGFGGQAQASADSTGYDFVDAAGVTRHQPRYTHSTAASFGGGGTLAIEAPVYRALDLRAVVAEWAFSGAPLEGDRARTLLGVGASLRVGR
jgi:hypothetical protein